MKILCAAKQLLGQREKQEDYVEYLSASPANQDKDEALLLLADGMGGYVGGEKASHLVVEKFIDSYQHQKAPVIEALRQGLDDANNELAATVAAQPEFLGMGCTLIAAHIQNMQLHWLSVGDSPFWIFRDKTLMRLNQDHSMAAVYARMVEMGQMTEEDARNEPMRNSLRSVVKGEEIPIVDLPETAFELQGGDILLLASDGLETLSIEQITSILQRNRGNNDMNALADELLEAVSAENNPVQDNASVIVYKVAVSASNANSPENHQPWYLHTLTLLIIGALSLSALIVLLLLQFKPEILSDPSSTKQPKPATSATVDTISEPPAIELPPQTGTAAPDTAPVLQAPAADTQIDAAPKPPVSVENVPDDTGRVLQGPVDSDSPLEPSVSKQPDTQSGVKANDEAGENQDDTAKESLPKASATDDEEKKETVEPTGTTDDSEKPSTSGAPSRSDSENNVEKPPASDSESDQPLPPPPSLNAPLLQDESLIVRSPLSPPESNQPAPEKRAERPKQPMVIETPRTFSQ